jgi:hypothetical protein
VRLANVEANASAIVGSTSAHENGLRILPLNGENRPACQVPVSFVDVGSTVTAAQSDLNRDPAQVTH